MKYKPQKLYCWISIEKTGLGKIHVEVLVDFWYILQKDSYVHQYQNFTTPGVHLIPKYYYFLKLNNVKFDLIFTKKKTSACKMQNQYSVSLDTSWTIFTLYHI
jgi:hypothetical protein